MERLFSAIPEFVKAIGTNEQIDRALAFAAWHRSAGALLRERTEPLEFTDRKLTIAVEDETWRRHLEDLAPQMLARLNQIVGQGNIVRVVFIVDPDSVSRRKLTSGDVESESEKTLDPKIDAAANAIADPELRAVFIKAANTSLAFSGSQDN